MRRRIILEGNKTEKVTINVSTSNGASASGITVTINGSATTTNADGVAYGEVPFDTSYSIVFGTKTNYSTPATITRTASADTYTTAVTYTLLNETCTVTSNVATTITINGNSKSNTKSHSRSIPYGTVYTVSVLGTSDGWTISTTSKTFTAGQSSRSVSFTYSPNYNGKAYVDLGLPSGTKWATVNVGAYNSTDYGEYYTYGGVKPCSEDASYRQSTSNETLPRDYDVARQVMGGAWHLPTNTQFNELLNNTNYYWTTLNGVDGVIFYATNGNHIFLPAAGYWDDGMINALGEWCNYRCNIGCYGGGSAYALGYAPDNSKIVGCYTLEEGMSCRGVIG